MSRGHHIRQDGSLRMQNTLCTKGTLGETTHDASLTSELLELSPVVVRAGPDQQDFDSRSLCSQEQLHASGPFTEGLWLWRSVCWAGTMSHSFGAVALHTARVCNQLC